MAIEIAVEATKSSALFFTFLSDSAVMQVWPIFQKKAKEPKSTEKKKMFKPCLNPM